MGPYEVFASRGHSPAASLTDCRALPAVNIAFQPIVNLGSRATIAYEALVRGEHGQSHPELVAGMNETTLRRFNRHTAAESIRRAVKLGIGQQSASLSINILPDLDSSGLDAYFVRDAAQFYGLPVNKIVLELTEDHHLSLPELSGVLQRNRECGFVSAMDDFGAGYSGLTALVECRPEILKLDRALVRGIDTSIARQKIVGAFVSICVSMQMVLVAEGVETEAEAQTLRKLGIDVMQGFLFSHPVVNRLPRLADSSYLPASSNGPNRIHLHTAGEWLSERFESVTGGTLEARTA